MTVKMMYNGIKADGKLYAGFWSRNGYVTENKVCFETITFYARGYSTLPAELGLKTQNDTDITIDYMDGDRVRFTPDHANYKEVAEAWKSQEIKRAKKAVAMWEKRISNGKATSRTETYLNEAKERLAKLEA